MNDNMIMENNITDSKKKKKIYARPEEAKEIFGMGRNTLMREAREANAIYKLKGMVLINIEEMDRYIHLFPDKD